MKNQQKFIISPDFKTHSWLRRLMFLARCKFSGGFGGGTFPRSPGDANVEQYVCTHYEYSSYHLHTVGGWQWTWTWFERRSMPQLPGRRGRSLLGAPARLHELWLPRSQSTRSGSRRSWRGYGDNLCRVGARTVSASWNHCRHWWGRRHWMRRATSFGGWVNSF